MLARSKSRPLAGTLFSPFSDKPAGEYDAYHNIHYTKHHLTVHGLHHLKLTPLPCCSSSPVSELHQENSSSFDLQGFRRAFSDSSLERLDISHCLKEEFHASTIPRKLAYRHQRTEMLHTAPSFSVFNTADGDEEEELEVDVEQGKEDLKRTVTVGDNIEAIGSGEFSFGKKGMGLIEEEGEEETETDFNEIGYLSIEEGKEPVSPPMYLATGLGIEGIDLAGLIGGSGGGGHVDLTLTNFDDGGDIEQYYKRMVDEYPCHPLFLSNYAQLLQSKGDLHGAEEFYHRATLADPQDGLIRSKYARLVWELHHDQDRALSNYELSVETAPQDSNVLAAYASFLWELDVDRKNNTSEPEEIQEEIPNKLNNSDTDGGFGAPKAPLGLRIDVGDPTASDADKPINVEEYYDRMIKENPCSSLVLANYAKFLCQSKGDIVGAEEYYSRAVLADPKDGEIMSQYAQFLWEFHGDRRKALHYLERAVEATPEDSYVLAAYASFLWETEENDANGVNLDHCQLHIHHEGSVTTDNA
ncbi:hypothetical protein K2173_003651 [Erythroxylum novogranatense]|uniref:Uncharacterized protein n=1 Tax=Erythroxylum novogranatense TaxID=1862640 RepID=A0AAV8TC30_9ROSI|nr:hypothetical protein K2173_003651 [Erythroxylum novogranatense]